MVFMRGMYCEGEAGVAARIRMREDRVELIEVVDAVVEGSVEEGAVARERER